MMNNKRQKSKKFKMTTNKNFLNVHDRKPWARVYYSELARNHKTRARKSL